MTVGKDALKDPEYLMQKLGGFDFASAGGVGSGEESLEAITNLKKTLAKVGWCWIQCLPKKSRPATRYNTAICLLLAIAVRSLACSVSARGRDSHSIRGLYKL